MNLRKFGMAGCVIAATMVTTSSAYAETFLATENIIKFKSLEPAARMAQTAQGDCKITHNALPNLIPGLGDEATENAVLVDQILTYEFETVSVKKITVEVNSVSNSYTDDSGQSHSIDFSKTDVQLVPFYLHNSTTAHIRDLKRTDPWKVYQNFMGYTGKFLISSQQTLLEGPEPIFTDGSELEVTLTVKCYTL